MIATVAASADQTARAGAISKRPATRAASLRGRCRLDEPLDCIMPPKSVAVVIGTRPEAIKMAEIIRILGPAALLIHTGQHYSETLWRRVVRDLDLPPHDLALAVGGSARSAQIGDAVARLGDAFRGARSVRAVVVHGDTNATLAGALAANAEDLPLFHVEAGLRSGDRRMPEEHNRVVVDHLADLCFAPTPAAYDNLADEGIPTERIQLTGNPVVEVARRLLPDAIDRQEACRRLGAEPGAYVLATLHRPENSDNAFRLTAILDDLRSLELPVVLPAHPRTREAAPSRTLDGISVIDPVCPRDFLALLAEARLTVTDSGGVQEEVSVLGRQALVVRRSTERPESLGAVAELVEPGPSLRNAARRRLSEYHPFEGLPARCVYGDGRASTRITNAIASASRSRSAA